MVRVPLGTPLIDFGERAYVDRLQGSGLSPEQVAEVRVALALALQADAIFDPSGLPPALRAVLVGYRDSYAVAFGQVLLIAAVLLAICAAIVWYGLRPAPHVTLTMHRRVAPPTSAASVDHPAAPPRRGRIARAPPGVRRRAAARRLGGDDHISTHPEPPRVPGRRDGLLRDLVLPLPVIVTCLIPDGVDQTIPQRFTTLDLYESVRPG